MAGGGQRVLSRAGHSLAAAAVVLGLASGCTSPVQAGKTRTSQGLRDVRPCPGIPGFNCGSLAAQAAPAGFLSQGLHASTLCADLRMPWGGPETPLAARPSALARAVARLKPSQVWPFDRATAAGNGIIQTCLYWPPTPVPAQGPAGAGSQAKLPGVPVLLLAGSHDLSTPLSGAQAQAARAPDGRLFVVPAAGHSVQSRAAGDAAQAEVARFLA